MKEKVTFFKNNVETNSSGYVGTFDGEIVFAHARLVCLIDNLSLERVPIDVYLKDSKTKGGKFGGYIACPENNTMYHDFKPKTGLTNQRFQAYVDSQNFCICLNKLSYKLSGSLNLFDQRLSVCRVLDKIDTVFPIDKINFFMSTRNNNTFIHPDDLDIIQSNNKYNLISIKRPVNKTDLDAPICDNIYNFADTSEPGGLLVLTGDGDYSFAIRNWLRKNPARVGACVAIKLTVSPELIELANAPEFDMLQLGSDSTFFNGCWVPDTRRHN